MKEGGKEEEKWESEHLKPTAQTPSFYCWTLASLCDLCSLMMMVTASILNETKSYRMYLVQIYIKVYDYSFELFYLPKTKKT